jgi:uncharacterized membrane protein
MDPQIEEIKELIRHNTALTIETNKMVHGMRRASRFSATLSALWWIIIIGASVGSYFYFLPYIHSLLDLYSAAQQNITHAQQILNNSGSSTPQR